MTRRPLLSLLLLVLAACVPASGSRVAPAAPVRGGEPGIPDDSWPAVYFQTFDQVVAAAGLAPLRVTRPARGEREVRIWIGGGIGYPQDLYRFVERRGDVTGELVYHWPTEGLPDARPGETFHDLMLHSQRGRCDGFAAHAEAGICRARFLREPDWGGVYRRAVAEGLWTLPDESTLPPVGWVTFDGWGITVELRDGASYRTYHYGNPENKPWREAARATRIAGLLGAIDSLVRPSDAVRVHRGVTTGRRASAFRPCDGSGPWEWQHDVRTIAPAMQLPLPAEASDTTALLYVEVEAELSPEWLARQWGSPYRGVLQLRRLVAVRPWTGRECS